MALIKCPECGESISDKAEKCPHCGLPAKYFKQQQEVQEKIDFDNLANILVSFDGDYSRLFSSSHYITHRDTEYLQDTYGDYYINLKNKMIFQYIENHSGQFRVDIDMLKSFLRKMHTLKTNIDAHTVHATHCSGCATSEQRDDAIIPQISISSAVKSFSIVLLFYGLLFGRLSLSPDTVWYSTDRNRLEM